MQRVVKMPNTSSYFRAKDVENARAILVVPHKVEFDVPTNFNGMAGTRTRLRWTLGCSTLRPTSKTEPPRRCWA